MDRPAGRKAGSKTGLGSENRQVLIREYAYRLLSRFIYSEKALFSKLSQKFPGQADEISGVIDELKGYNYIDDDRYAVYYRDQLTAKGYGPLYIREYLRRKGFSFSEALDTGDRTAAMEKWFRKKMANAGSPEQKDWQRLFVYLRSKGFRSEEILEFLRSKKYRE